MPLIASGPAYRAMRALTPRIFTGREAASLDFVWQDTGAGVIEFTPIITGEVTEYDWNFGDGSEHSTTESPSHDYEA